ncbi:MAG: NADH-quinone oxidoreductase subunit C [bacterium]
MSKKVLDLVQTTFSDDVIYSHSRLGNDTVVVKRESLVAIMEFLRDNDATKMNFLRDITAVDYLHRTPRFEVVYVLYSMDHKHMLIVRVPLNEDDVQIPSVSHLWGCAGWLEREVFDMYGMIFTNHPDLRRVLLYEEFEGHPLRKDYATQASQPRVELLKPERDSVEEFLHFHKDKDQATGSRVAE